MSNYPPEAIVFYFDRSSLCCVFADFQNLQESPAGFGKSVREALLNLRSQPGLGDMFDTDRRDNIDDMLSLLLGEVGAK